MREIMAGEITVIVVPNEYFVLKRINLLRFKYEMDDFQSVQKI